MPRACERAARGRLIAQGTACWRACAERREAIAAGLDPEQSTEQVQQAKVQRVLTAAGFTDIKIVTSSLLVQAKSPAGKPVMMIVHPNALTAQIMEPDSTTGSAGPNQNSDPALR